MDLYYCFINDENMRNKYVLQHNTGIKLTEYAARNFYDINNTEIEIINNKPEFKYSDKQFNISHSKNVVIVCFDDSPIGVDIEYIKPRDYIELAKRMGFKLKEKTPEEFYMLWTQYEAEYKLGCKAEFIKSQIFLNDYMLSVASVNQINELNIKELKI